MTRWWMVALAVIAGGCDRDLVPSPQARHDAQEVAEARRLEQQLVAIPGVASASVVVRRPFVDPLAPLAPASPPSPPAAASASILVVEATASASIEQTVRTLARAALPDVPLSIVVAPPVAAPVTTAKVGPFTVAADSKHALQATLAIALAVIAALAGYVAITQRRGIRPHQSSASTTRGS